MTPEQAAAAGITAPQHWRCQVCPAGYFCAWGDLPIMFGGAHSHRHVWIALAGRPWPLLPWAFPWALAIAEEAWVQRELAGAISDSPPYVTAVAAVLGVDALLLWDRVESVHGWEPHDDGYRQAVWNAAWYPEPPPPARWKFRPNAALQSQHAGWPYPMHSRVAPWQIVWDSAGVFRLERDRLADAPLINQASGFYLEGDNVVGPWRYMGRRR